MIFESFAQHLKPFLFTELPLETVLSEWIRSHLNSDPLRGPQSDPSLHVTSVLQSEFKLIELPTKKVYMITPRSGRASYLLQLLSEYITVMEEKRTQKLTGVTGTRK